MWGVAVTGVPASFSDLAYELVFGVPVPVIIALMVLLIAFLVLQYTPTWPSNLRGWR